VVPDEAVVFAGEVEGQDDVGALVVIIHSSVHKIQIDPVVVKFTSAMLAEAKYALIRL
jgi:hypothetical protein